MDIQKINRIFEETAYVRVSGTDAELKCADYLKKQCKEMGLDAHVEAFEVDMADIKKAVLIADGKEIPCTGYLCAGTHEVEAPLHYLTNTDKGSLAECRGKIVLVDGGGVGYWKYQDLLENGVLGFISYTGNANYADDDITTKELRAVVSKGQKIPCVNINVKQAIELVKNEVQTVKITLEQDEYKGHSHNVVLDLPGDIPETIVLTAHYDSVPLSKGAYDNMSGSIGLLMLAEHFKTAPHRYGLRFIWCGSEERGLLGSKAYLESHEDEIKNIVLNVNLDMIGCIMGDFAAGCTTEEKLIHFLQYFASIKGFGIRAVQEVYPSDSTPFADKGIPALTFARSAPGNTATIHNAYDTAKVMSARQLQRDIEFVGQFVSEMANAAYCPVSREMPENMKEKLDVYMFRKREK